jgi:hypothetical protein
MVHKNCLRTTSIIALTPATPARDSDDHHSHTLGSTLAPFPVFLPAFPFKKARIGISSRHDPDIIPRAIFYVLN